MLKGLKILLSRCDSDDALDRNFIADTQKQEYKDRKAITCSKGYVFFISSPPLWKRIKWRIGQILTKVVNNKLK